MIQDLIDTILWDRFIVGVPLNIEAPHREIIFLYPTLLHKRLATHARTVALEAAKAAGVPSEVELLSIAAQAGQWTPQQERLLSEGEKEIASLTEALAKVKFFAAKRKIQVQIDKVKSGIAAATAAKQDFASKSAERMADVQYIYSLLMQTVFTPRGELIFRSETDLTHIAKSYAEFFYFLVNALLSENLLVTPDIRKVARSVEWRMLWSLQKENLGQLFNRSVPDLTLNQKSLIYWSRIYDMAFEAYENKPSNEVVENDDRFDEWLHSHLSDKKADKTSKKTKSMEEGVIIEGEFIDVCTCGAGTKRKGLGESPQHINGCQYGLFRRYSSEEIEAAAQEVYGKNDTAIRRLMAKEQDVIAERKHIDERQLRNRKSRQMLGLGENREKARR